jgi:multisubunit Na+/H+ antiporter MnhF subunit
VNGFVAAGIAMMLGLGPCIVVLIRDELMAAVAAYELASAIAVMVFVCLSQGFGRSGEFELAVVLAVLLYSSGLVFVRSLERWL